MPPAETAARASETHPGAGRADSLPLVVHVVHQLAMGGMENGLVNLINRMDGGRYRHAVACMTQSSSFSRRLRGKDVPIYELRRGEVPLAAVYWRLFRLFRSLKPAIVHSRNLSGLDALLPAACAGVPIRIHGEHGRDIDDLDGSNARHRRLKRTFRPLVTHYTAVSQDLAHYLVHAIGVPPQRVRHICNGVDTEIFRPAQEAGAHDDAAGPASRFVVGTVGRLQPVKDQLSLVKAFAAACERAPAAMRAARLVIVGEGPMRAELERAIDDAGLASRAELNGASDAIAEALRGMDVFVLPSLAEGISNTLLEAMATGLPTVATRVGGNSELVEHERTGALVTAGDWSGMADRIVVYAADRMLRREHGKAARARAEREFSLDAMVRKYGALYDELSAARNAGGLRRALRTPS